MTREIAAKLVEALGPMLDSSDGRAGLQTMVNEIARQYPGLIQRANAVIELRGVLPKR